MTTLIEKIQAEIDRAAEKCVDRDSLEIRDADREARAFKFGARFLLPLLKKAIAQRDESIRQLVNKKMISKNTAKEISDITINVGNQELLKLIGGEHE